MAENDIQQLVQEFREELVNAWGGGDPILVWGTNIVENSDRTNQILAKFLRAANLDRQVCRQNLDRTIGWRAENDLNFNDDDTVVPNYWICNTFGGLSCLEIDFHRWLSWVASRPNPQPFSHNWREAFELVVRRLELNNSGAPAVVVVVDFSGAGVIPTPLSTNFQIFKAIEDTKRYYPNIILEEVFIGNLCTRFLSRWRGARWRNAVSPKNAHRPLFRYLPSQLINDKFGGSIGMPNVDRFVSGNVDVPHGKMSSIRIPITQGRSVRIKGQVISWNVKMKIEFVPLERRQHFSTILFEEKLIHDDQLQDNMLIRNLQAPVDGNIFVTIQNSSFSTRKLIVDCLFSPLPPIDE